jgi:hypothetical protein
LFGLREIAKRELKKRELKERWPFSLVWTAEK